MYIQRYQITPDGFMNNSVAICMADVLPKSGDAPLSRWMSFTVCVNKKNRWSTYSTGILYNLQIQILHIGNNILFIHWNHCMTQ